MGKRPPEARQRAGRNTRTRREVKSVTYKGVKERKPSMKNGFSKNVGPKQLQEKEKEKNDEEKEKYQDEVKMYNYIVDPKNVSIILKNFVNK